MILFQDFLENIKERIKAESETSFDRASISKEQLLADKYKMDTLWALYQKSITEYLVSPDDAYAYAMKEVTGITVVSGSDETRACEMCLDASIDPELNSDNDLSFIGIGECAKGYRMLLRSGDGKPVAILVERWSDTTGWQTIGCYQPKYCPNCGRELKKQFNDT